jgi:hypothetical protein
MAEPDSLLSRFLPVGVGKGDFTMGTVEFCHSQSSSLQFRNVENSSSLRTLKSRP